MKRNIYSISRNYTPSLLKQKDNWLVRNHIKYIFVLNQLPNNHLSLITTKHHYCKSCSYMLHKSIPGYGSIQHLYTNQVSIPDPTPTLKEGWVRDQEKPYLNRSLATQCFECNSWHIWSNCVPKQCLTAPRNILLRYRWFSWGVASLPEGKSWGPCLPQLVWNTG